MGSTPSGPDLPPLKSRLQPRLPCRQPYESSCRKGCGGIRLLSRSGFPRIFAFPFQRWIPPYLLFRKAGSRNFPYSIQTGFPRTRGIDSSAVFRTCGYLSLVRLVNAAIICSFLTPSFPRNRSKYRVLSVGPGCLSAPQDLVPRDWMQCTWPRSIAIWHQYFSPRLHHR